MSTRRYQLILIKQSGYDDINMHIQAAKEALETKVNDLLNQGWEPLGSHNITIQTTRHIYDHHTITMSREMIRPKCDSSGKSESDQQ
jgi:hypothetical protein